MPDFVEPMLAEAVHALPTEAGWGYEPKIDGHRTQIRKAGDNIDVRTRNGKRPIVSVRQIAAAAKAIKADQAIIDGELTALNGRGVPSFQLLQARDISHGIVFWAFDLLYLDGQDLREERLATRQALLAKVIDGTGLQLCAALPGTPEAIFEAVRQMEFEGIVAKRVDSPYQSGDRTSDWQKKRFDRGQEFVIGGYRPDGDRVDALLVGVYQSSDLMFAGKLRGGLNQWNRVELFNALRPLEVASCPFADLPTSEKKSRRKSSWNSGGVAADEMDEITWVKPKLVAQLTYVEWPEDGLLRHAKFIALRNDKKAKDVVRETG